ADINTCTFCATATDGGLTMNDSSSQTPLTRRTFLSGAAALAVGGSAKPRRRVSLPDKVNLAVVGAGGRGADDLSDLKETGAVNVVALCDCDWNHAADSFKGNPSAKKYSDWRKMFEAEKNFDAVLVATPD